MNRPSEASSYVEEELAEYPNPKRAQTTDKRSEYVRKEVIQNYLRDREVQLLKLSLKLEKEMTYL